MFRRALTRIRDRVRQQRYRETNRDAVRARHAAWAREKYESDPEAGRQKSAEWRDANPEKLREMYARQYAQVGRGWALMKKYGLTEDAWLSLLESQGGVCAICRTDKPGGRYSTFHVDHDHATGKIRGLLCDSCNRGIGMLQERPDVLQAAAAYLVRSK